MLCNKQFYYLQCTTVGPWLISIYGRASFINVRKLQTDEGVPLEGKSKYWKWTTSRHRFNWNKHIMWHLCNIYCKIYHTMLMLHILYFTC